MNLSKYLKYDPNSGIITWIKRPSKRVKIGQIAGYKRADGYIVIKLLGKHYYAHRVAWELYNGTEPPKHIDHIDGDPSNNKIKNLKLASQRENCQNYKIHRKGKPVGANYVQKYKKYKKYRSRIRVNGVQHNLGYFDTEQEAHSAYLNALSKINGGNN